MNTPTIAQALTQAHTLGLPRIDAQLLLLHTVGRAGSDRIRTYNFPQGRLTDHRINLTLYKLQYVMDGDLAEVLQALAHAREAEQLEELEMGASIQGGQ